MNKKYFISGFFVLLVLTLVSLNTARAQVFEKGTRVLDAGIEFTGSGVVSVVPVYGNFEMGVTDDIGLGARVRFWSKNGVNSFTLQPTGTYHFNRILNLPVEQLDLFASLGIGYQRASGYGESIGGFILTPYVGGRYYFTERVGATAKLGFDSYSYEGISFTSTNFSIGVSLKF